MATKTLTKAKTTSKSISPVSQVYEAYGDQRFYVCDGQVISKLNDLPSTIENMNDGTYSYHVNGDRNDFSAWIDSVFGMKDLAVKVYKSKTKAALIKAVNSYLK